MFNQDDAKAIRFMNVALVIGAFSVIILTLHVGNLNMQIRDMKQQATEHYCAQYNAQDGSFEWKMK